MTKIILIILISSMTSCNTVTNGQVPEAVKTAFKNKYPNENDPDWKKDKNGNHVIQPTRKTKVESTILTLSEALKFEVKITFRNLDYHKLKEIKKDDKKAA